MLTCSVPLIFDHVAKTHNDPKQKNFNNKGQRLNTKKISICILVNHGNYCDDIISYSLLNRIFYTWSCKPHIFDLISFLVC